MGENFTASYTTPFWYKKLLNSPTPHNKSIYKRYKNTLTKLIRTAKQQYLCKKFNQEKGNVKGTWKLINSLLSKSKIKQNTSYFVNNDVRVSNDEDYSKCF
jgi:hypothetical protein